MRNKKQLSDVKLKLFSSNTQTELPLPVADGGVKAGFPSPAQDYMDLSIDLNKEFIRHPAATFFARVSGDSMRDAGISDGDLLIIDKSLEVKDGKIAVCYLDGEFTVKQVRIEKDGVLLMPANVNYKPMKVGVDNDFLVWGIVVHVIKSF